MASDPQAKIYINNELKGIGRAEARVPRNKTLIVRAEKDGYSPVSRMIENKLSGTGVLDTIGGWFIIVPWIGLAFPGAYELDKSSVDLDLSIADKIEQAK